MTNAEKYWQAVEQKNAALMQVKKLNDEMTEIHERLKEAIRAYDVLADEARQAFMSLDDAEREEVRTTNTWGNA